MAAVGTGTAPHVQAEGGSDDEAFVDCPGWRDKGSSHATASGAPHAIVLRNASTSCNAVKCGDCRVSFCATCWRKLGEMKRCTQGT